jgi:hypothetical protein
MVLQSLKDSGEAAGEVSSMYSTPKASRLCKAGVWKGQKGISVVVTTLGQSTNYSRPGNLDLGLEGEEGVGELLTLYYAVRLGRELAVRLTLPIFPPPLFFLFSLHSPLKVDSMIDQLLVLLKKSEYLGP